MEDNRMRKKFIAASLLLIIVLSLTACNGEELPSAEEIVTAFLDSQQNVETYQLDMDMDMDATVEAEGETFEMNMGIDCTGTMDVTNAEMKMVMDINMMMPDVGEIEMAEAVYLVDDMMYIGVDMPVSMGGSAWMKSQIPGDMIEGMNQVESLTALVETAEITVLGSEKVNGVDCYAVEVIPDADQLWELVSQQLQLTGDELEIPDTAGDVIRNMYDNISVTYYIDKDTYFLVRSSFDMSLEMTPEDLGYPEEEGLMIMDIMMDMLMFDYNLPVSIELPPEAEDAIEMPLGNMPW
jgi:hypothetical protein